MYDGTLVCSRISSLCASDKNWVILQYECVCVCFCLSLFLFILFCFFNSFYWLFKTVIFLCFFCKMAQLIRNWHRFIEDATYLAKYKYIFRTCYNFFFFFFKKRRTIQIDIIDHTMLSKIGMSH